MRKALLTGLMLCAGLRAGPVAAAVEAALSVSPAPVAVGGVVTVTFTVTNTGALDEPAVSATLSVDLGEVLLLPLTGPVPPDPVTITAGGSTLFVWTFSVTGEGALAFTATATDAVPVAASAALTALMPAALSVTLATFSYVTVVGVQHTLLVDVVNTGGFAATGVVPVFEVNEGGVGPFGAPVPATADLPPGASTRFICAVPANAPGVVRITVTVGGTDTGLGGPVVAAAFVSATVLTPAALSLSLEAGPSPVVAGSVLTVTLWAQNTGEAAADLTPSLAPAFGATLLAPRSAPGPQVVDGLNRVPFVWTFSVSGCGTVGFTATISGFQIPVVAPVGGWAASNPVLLKGDPFDPADDAATAGSWLAPGPGWGIHGPHALCGGDPADWYRVSLERGAAYRFETAGAGDAFAEMFDDPAGSVVVASDDDGAGGLQSRVDVTPGRAGTFWMRVRTVPAGMDWAGSVLHRRLLMSSLSISPATAVTGQLVTIVLTVTNTGDADLTGAAATITPDAALALGTVPAPVTVLAGGSAAFTWTATVTGAGTPVLTATVTGLDAGTGRSLASFATAGGTMLRPAALAAQVSAVPDPAATGNWISIRLTVTNTGNETANGVTPVLGFTQGAGRVTPISAPAGSISLASGASTTFAWTYSASGAGGVAFSITAAGLGELTGGSAQTAAHGTFSIGERAALIASLLVSPGTAEIGTVARVVLSVTNTGTYAATGVLPMIEAVSGGGLATDLSGPVPAGPVTIGPLGHAFFTWTYSMTGAGAIWFSATAAGTDAGTGGPAITSATAAIVTATPPSLASALSLAPPVPVAGQVLTVTLTATNAGGVPVSNVMPWISVNRGAGLLTLVTGPSPAGPVVLGAGGGTQSFTWTYVVTGGGAIEFTATAAGQDFWTTAAIGTAVTAGTTALRPAALAAQVSAAPDPAATGQWIAIRLTVTNTGDETANGVTPVLGFTQGAGLASPISSPSGGITLASGGSATFAWTYSASGAGVVAFSATASGVGALAGGSAQAAAHGTFSIGTRAALVASLLVSPATAEIGTVARVVLSVTNTGGYSAMGVVPMIEAVSGGSLATDLSGPVPAGPVTISPLGHAFFTWTYSITGPGALVLSATAAGTDAGGGAPVAASAAGTITTAAGPALAGWLTLSPAQPVTAQFLTAVLTVSNTGGVTVNSAVPVIQVNRGAGVVSAFAGPTPAGPVTLAAGGGQSFTWTYWVNGGGAVDLTATVAGQDAWTGVVRAASATAGLTALRPAALVVASAAWPDPAATGQWIAVTATVTNTGDETANGVTPAIQFTQGGGLAAVIAAPAGGVTLAAGGSATFTWTYSASGAGAVAYTVSATGTGALTAAPVLGAASRTVVIQDRAALIASLLMTPALAEIGQVVRVVLSVTNTGSFAAAGVVPVIGAVAGGGLATDLSGPVPAGPVTIAPLGHAFFTWTYSISGPGALVLSATAAGVDGGSGAPVTASAAATVTTAAPPSVSAALSLSPAVPVAGQVLTVTLTATNAGGVPVSNVMPWIAVNRGAGLLAPVTGPSPAGPVVLGAGGGTQTFTWTYLVNGGGAIELTATAVGTDAWTGAVVVAAAGAATGTLTPARFSATLELTAMPAGAFLTGGRGVAVLRVTNLGGTDATGVGSAASAYAGGGLLAPVSGPVPAGPVTLAAGASAAFTWTWSLTGAGMFGISATVSGTDAVTAAPVAVLASVGATILRRGDLAVTLGAPASVHEGDVFEVTLDVINTGDDPVAAPAPVLTSADPARLEVVALQAAPGGIAPGATGRARWTVRALREGVAGLAASVTARRDADGSVASASAAATLTVVSKFGEVPITAWPNPVAGDDVRIALRLNGPADRVVVEVYSASFRKIADGEWWNVMPGAGAQLRMTGVRGWSPGVYLVRAKAWYADGTSMVFDPVKVAVKR